ncbi:hypothetical protein BV25DRAFT_1887478 [Artomyces pyxidatus]|uniref:Uncharacterized protein n=1 Tax=Artomyces pyxidatus TaxID=48021 RepID=A0ACB8SY07_9AGAM|nr:hypothetical protein BV25DRAFT_1887478 [Artomyces pyxidatus]
MPPPPSPPSKKKAKTAKPPQSPAPMSDNTPKTPSKKPVSKALKRVSIASLAEVKGSSPQLLSKGNPQRPQTPDVDRDDVSVAESSKGNRRTEEERRQFFLDQPECREVEPHRAFCTGCNEWVALNPSRPYVMRPWTVHRKDCRRNSISAKPVSKASPNKAEDEESDEDDARSNLHSTSDKSVRKGEAERQAYFEADPRAEEVRPYEVLCKTCQKWIKLETIRRYALTNWKAHQSRCSGSIPSSRVATAERKLKLVNDAAAKRFTTKSVVCAHCKETVALEGEGDYNLAKWDDHKASCASAPDEPAAASPDAQPISSPEQSPHRSEKSTDRPPPSVASTEATAVALDMPGPSRPSTKRPREDEEGQEEVEEPPRTRARTESYKPSGVMGWLLLPFKSFVDGFKEAMQAPSGSAPT